MTPRSSLLAGLLLAFSSNPASAAGRKPRPLPDAPEHYALADALIRAYAKTPEADKPRRVIVPQDEGTSTSLGIEANAAYRFLEQALVDTRYFDVFEAGAQKEGDLLLRYSNYLVDGGAAASARLVEFGSGRVVAVATWPAAQAAPAQADSPASSTGTAESHYIERAGVSAESWSLWLSAGGGYITDKLSGTIGVTGRTPGGRWEGSLQAWTIRKEQVLSFAGPGNGLDETQSANVMSLRLNMSRRLPLNYLGIPGVFRLRIPMTLRVGAGMTAYQIETKQRVLQKTGLVVIDQSDSHSRLAPSLHAGLGKALSNVAEIELVGEHAFVPTLNGIGTSIKYDGFSTLLRFSYRIF